MATKQLSDNNTDGTVMGQSATDKISFYGVTTLAQQTITGTLTSSATATTIGNSVTELQAALKAIGLITY